MILKVTFQSWPKLLLHYRITFLIKTYLERISELLALQIYVIPLNRIFDELYIYICIKSHICVQILHYLSKRQLDHLGFNYLYIQNKSKRVQHYQKQIIKCLKIFPNIKGLYMLCTNQMTSLANSIEVAFENNDFLNSKYYRFFTDIYYFPFHLSNLMTFMYYPQLII